MAVIVKPTYFDAVVNAGEQKLMDFLEVNLPDDFFLIPNIELVSTNSYNNQTQYWEYDLIVVAPHAIFNIENKDWRGRIEGDDTNWYLNDQPRRNPLRTNRQKTAILASKLKEQNSYWGKAWVQNTLTLSYDNYSPPIITPEDDKLTFQLNKRLINFLTDASELNKSEDAIADIQKDIVNYLTGQQAQKRAVEKKQIYEFEIVKVLHQENNFVEYLGKYVGSTSSQRRIKEYALQVVGLSPLELKNREDKIKNQYNALKDIKGKPFILNVEFRIDEENHLFYEISEYFEENSLRSEARIKTFTFKEKVEIIKNIMVALKEAHNKNIFHRDINPDNIFLNSGYAYLGNFGKSYFVDHSEEGYTVMPTINQSNATAYHPLELTVGDASIASDIYSLGVLIYWLFTEKEPFATPFELNNLGGKLPENLLPSKINTNLPKWIDEVCEKSIITDEFQRIESIEKLIDIIDSALAQNTSNVKSENNVPAAVKAVSFEEIKEGDTIGDYAIHKVLGKGGYSKVFKVKHRLQDKFYTLKLFNESVFVNSVKDEYLALIELHHNNIVKFSWNGETPNGQFYTVMEYLEGENLRQYIATDVSMPIHQVYNVGIDILSALVEMQKKERPIIHRDIKPQNIIWDKGERFVLIDFNVASTINENKDFVGTNPYLAPDLIESNYKVNWDFTADLFALGVTMFELICKQYPWHPNKMPLRDRAANEPKSIEPRISLAFSNFIAKAIQTNKNDRFQSAQEMLNALKEIEGDILENIENNTTEASSRNKLYHTQISIIQGTSFNLKLFNSNNTYVDLHEAIAKALDKFKENIEKYKTSIDLGDKIKLVLKVDDEMIINDMFWQGGARNFNPGNIERVYSAMKDLFEQNKDKIKAHKISVEGINMVDYVNSLYSQSKHGNFGTRVNTKTSELDNETYTPTKLDKTLLPAIIDGKYKLIIITGNAGDGKTAFVKKIEGNPSVKNIQHFSHNNGARFQINGVYYESNYDGSQDEKETENTSVLEKFFAPFENLTNYNRAEEGRIIAINEGRLVEFLTTSTKHKKLAKNIEDYFYEEGNVTLPDGILVINLNLRSVVANNEEGDSLFKKQMEQLTRKELWKNCEGCDLANSCFINYNVKTFNNEVSGDAVIKRLEWLLRTVSLKRELHITMRDVRSFIAFLLTRDYACEDIPKVIQEANGEVEKFWNLFYFNISNPKNIDSGDKDRLIKLIRETDIGEVAIPKLDRELFFNKHREKDYLFFENREFNIINVFNEIKAYLPAYEQSVEYINNIRERQKTFIRHQYFEGKLLANINTIFNKENGIEKSVEIGKPAYLLRLPYKSVYDFVNVLNKEKLDESIKKTISRAVSLNEGCNNPDLDEKNLVLASTEIKDPYGKSFKLFSLDEFDLFVNKAEHLTKYIEYEADSLIFRHKKHKHISLTISLDLFEMLYFIQKGFSPSLNDLKGKFIELIVFKNLLENLKYDEIVITSNNREFYSIKKAGSSNININKVKI
ncbi:methylation-associated defense system protein kinase MAD6 [Flavobacterium haoranii]|uniref:Serine/threonine protein kinase n=1 Tax=Flavobacterium haoranii TaxID=683124 RepID=A0A1M6C1E6_9FLAO|nr:serine/threonine protein kinase [Flavobacterium haoranii]SHI54554.1 Serine/threonine protein kinase [Flavobacterium haoranii]